jgi:PAS domain S-box-containing protein
MYSPLRFNLALISGLASILTGLLVLTGVTATGFIVAGVALLLTRMPAGNYRFFTVLLASILLIVLGALELDWSVSTAVCFMLLGAGSAGSLFKNAIIQTICQYFLNAVTVIASLAVIGYLYGMPLFYSLNLAGPMAIVPAVLFFVLSLVTALLQPDRGITRLFTGKLIGNIMAKRLLVLILVVLFGAVRLLALRLKLFSFQEDMAILIVGFLGVGVALLWHMVNRLNSIDYTRQKAERAVEGMNRELEERVKLRSAKLLVLLAKLKQSEAKFRTAFQHSAIGMALISLKGKWLKVNKSLCDMVGYRERELLKMSFMQLTHHDDDELGHDIMDKALQGNKEPFRIEKRYICKDGSVVWVSINIATVLDHKGSALYFVSQFENITERKKAEKKLKAAYKQIKDHITVIQDMNWKQSHVLRSPLANLKGLTALLQQDPSNDATLKHIHYELNRLDKTILEMAEGACDQGVVQMIAKKRSFRPAV